MSENKWEEVGSFLRNERSRTGLSLFKVAKQVGITGNYLSLIERGIQTPSNAVLVALGNFYNLDLEGLFNMYGRVYDSSIKEALRIPSLRKILMEITTNNKLSAEEKEEVAQEVYSITMDILSKRK